MSDLLTKISAHHVKPTFTEVKVGDTVRVYTRVKEGDKERTQYFEGLVIRRRGGIGMSATFTVRRLASGVGVERTFPVHSPLIEKITVRRAAKVRRATLYTMRGLTGKAARLTEKPVKSKEREVTHPWIAKFGIKVEEPQPKETEKPKAPEKDAASPAKDQDSSKGSPEQPAEEAAATEKGKAEAKTSVKDESKPDTKDAEKSQEKSQQPTKPKAAKPAAGKADAHDAKAKAPKASKAKPDQK